jgi:hypothetical protein
LLRSHRFFPAISFFKLAVFFSPFHSLGVELPFPFYEFFDQSIEVPFGFVLDEIARRATT